MKLSFPHGISPFFRKGIVLEDGAQVRDLNHSFLQEKIFMEQSPKDLDYFFFFLIKSFHTS